MNAYGICGTFSENYTHFMQSVLYAIGIFSQYFLFFRSTMKAASSRRIVYKVQYSMVFPFLIWLLRHFQTHLSLLRACVPFAACLRTSECTVTSGSDCFPLRPFWQRGRSDLVWACAVGFLCTLILDKISIRKETQWIKNIIKLINNS